jgi:hypothetical protein
MPANHFSLHTIDARHCWHYHWTRETGGIRAPISTVISFPKDRLRFRIAATSRKVQPITCGLFIGFDPSALQVHVPQAALRRDAALLCCFRVPAHCLPVVLLDTAP